MSPLGQTLTALTLCSGVFLAPLVWDSAHAQPTEEACHRILRAYGEQFVASRPLDWPKERRTMVLEEVVTEAVQQCNVLPRRAAKCLAVTGVDAVERCLL